MNAPGYAETQLVMPLSLLRRNVFSANFAHAPPHGLKITFRRSQRRVFPPFYQPARAR
jgi:hypothetical protein